MLTWKLSQSKGSNLKIPKKCEFYNIFLNKLDSYLDLIFLVGIFQENHFKLWFKCFQWNSICLSISCHFLFVYVSELLSRSEWSSSENWKLWRKFKTWKSKNGIVSWKMWQNHDRNTEWFGLSSMQRSFFARRKAVVSMYEPSPNLPRL